MNQTRLRTLLEFLQHNRRDFVTIPISAVDEEGADVRHLNRPSVSVPSRMALARMLENGINDRVWWY
ncbi:MAG: hypothetical protein JO212_17495 [Acetobacteraceae bacterium]|nr:hypothetical protein [Acetobacteraceae bacterium]